MLLQVEEGVELFEETMAKMQEANSDNQREKFQVYLSLEAFEAFMNEKYLNIGDVIEFYFGVEQIVSVYWSISANQVLPKNVSG